MVAGLNYPATAGGTAGGVLSLTSAPEGGWSLVQHAIGLYYNGYTYFNWVSGATGALKVASYNHTTDAISTAVQIDSMGSASNIDDHENAGMLVRDSDHKLMVFFCLHNGANMFVSISTTSLDTDPTLADGFATAVNLDASIGASDYTYPEAYQLTGVTNDPIYLFYRDQSSSTGRLAYSKSTNGGSTWSARTVVMTAASTNRGYWAVRATTDRIDVIATDRDPYGSEGAVDIGHMYLDGSTDKWYTSAAVEITATKPFLHSEMTQLETDLSGGFGMDVIPGSSPIVSYLIDNGDGTVTAKYGVYSAGWSKHTIYGPTDYNPGDRFFAGLAINRADTSEVFSGIKSGASSSEMYSYTTSDGGTTWDGGTALTTGSGDLNWGVTPVINADSTLPCIWLRGTWSSDAVFNQGIRGLAR